MATKKQPPPITCTEAAERHDVTPRRIQRLANDGRIPGAKLHAGVWLIPSDFTVLPPPKRKRQLEKITA